MTKAELVKNVAESTGVSQKAVIEVLDAAFNKIAGSDGIILRGFGTFKFKTTKPRVGRNPKTGEPVQIESKTTLVFKAAK